MMISFPAVMVRWSLMVLIGALACMPLTSAQTGPTHGKVVICYLSSWAVFRPGKGSFSIANIDPRLCSHIVYAFAGLDATQDGIKSLEPYLDLKNNNGKGGYERLTALKKFFPHLKVILAIGGWNDGSKNYSIMTADPNRRQRFVKNVSNFIRQFKFDGLDLYWKYPTQRGGEPEDRDNFVLLVKELREEFNKYNLILTSAISGLRNIIDEAYNVRELAKYLDYFNVLTYDYHGNWDGKVGPNAPLEDEGSGNVKFTIEYMLQLGCPASKLVMGLPFNGRTYKTLLAGNFEDDADYSSFEGPFTRENGFLGYNEICALNWTRSWDEKTAQTIARHYDEGVTNVVVYDSTRSIANKVRFAVQKELAGVLVWSMDTDDFLGECEPETDTYADFGSQFAKLVILRRIYSNYPLLRTINEGIILAKDGINQPNISAGKDTLLSANTKYINIDSNQIETNEILEGELVHVVLYWLHASGNTTGEEEIKNKYYNKKMRYINGN